MSALRASPATATTPRSPRCTPATTPSSGYTRSIARDADDAADALQNAWIAALIALRADRRRRRCAPGSSGSPTTRRSTSCAGRLSRGPHDRPRLADRVPGVDEQYDRTETMAEVVGDMRELPTNQRAALVRELADLDYGEIAIALSTSEGNARQAGVRRPRRVARVAAPGALPCDAVRGVLARADGRELRRSRLRAHPGCLPGLPRVRRRRDPAGPEGRRLRAQPGAAAGDLRGGRAARAPR